MLNGAVSLWLSKIISNFNPLNDKPLWFKVLNKQFDPLIDFNKLFYNTDSSWNTSETWSLYDTFGSEMHRYMQAPFCDAVVIGSADVRHHQVVTVFTVYSRIIKLLSWKKKPVIRLKY